METNRDTEIRRTLHIADTGLRVREADGDTPSRTITGYAILFNTPSVPLWADEDGEAREVIAPEAITKELLDECDIKFTMYHDRQLILGRSNRGTGTLEYFVDDKGVGFSLELPKSPNGDEALELVSRGDISGCSFAFTTRYWDKNCVSRTIKTVGGKALTTYTVRVITGVYDFTLAADPAYPDTSVEARELVSKLRSTENDEPKKDNEKMRKQLQEMRCAAKQNIF